MMDLMRMGQQFATQQLAGHRAPENDTTVRDCKHAIECGKRMRLFVVGDVGCED
jgi:hypothetical protein